MTLSQRLTRAGAAFIIFGTAAVMLPTNGNAFSATDSCTVSGQMDYVGNSSADQGTSYSIAGTTSGSTLALNAYPEGSSTVTGVSDSNATNGTTSLATTFSGNSITTTVTYTGSTSAAISDGVTVTFSDGHTVNYIVTHAATS